MDHLFNNFEQKGIHAFRDDNDLPRGEYISPQLYKAIEESRVLIVIFSKYYASSSWKQSGKRYAEALCATCVLNRAEVESKIIDNISKEITQSYILTGPLDVAENLVV
ncbi:NB-ARC domains-containing protein [Tanacetum coccineum]